MSDLTAAEHHAAAAIVRAQADRTGLGDHVAVLHDCEGLGSSTVRHDTPVLVTSVDRCDVAGLRIRGVRCDGSRIEWLWKDAD